jgi:YhcH/YjgK/YiaL family protein
MFWTPVPLLRPVGSYDPKRDVLFFDEAVGSPVAVESGCFAVFFPEDAHKPGCLLEKALAVRKVVVKVLCAG